jgi:Domain of unknown function (DUF222)
MVLVLADLKQIEEATAELAAAPFWLLADDDVVQALRSAHRLGQAAAVIQARLVQRADSGALPRQQGYRSTAGWLGDLLPIDSWPARQMADQAAALSRRPAVEQAVLDGRVDLQQAAEIANAVEAIPADLSDFPDLSLADTARLVAEAESTLISWADRLTATQLGRVGERILAHIAPEVADRTDEAALIRQEARAHRRRGFTLSRPVDGIVRVSGVLGLEDADTVQAALHTLCQPIPDDDRSRPQRRADALVEVFRLALNTGELPADGGEPPQMSVVVPYDPLTNALGAATTDTGRRLSAATARRMACDARILPVVLGGAGQVLDVGRTRRLATGPQRRALHIRDKGCAFPDCERPPRWTDAHHLVAWTDGGPTDLNNLRSH